MTSMSGWGKEAFSHWEQVKQNRVERLSRAPEDSGSMRQTHLFTVPPPPVAVAWDIYWRWNPAMRTECLHPEDVAAFDEWMGENPWQKHRRWYNLSPPVNAEACLEELRLASPGKEFKLEASKWPDATLSVLL